MTRYRLFGKTETFTSQARVLAAASALGHKGYIRITQRKGKDYEAWVATVPEYPCMFSINGGTCYHARCRGEALKARGLANVAARLAVNADVKDWQRNWGLMLYEPKRHGRDPDRRRAMAKIIRQMRAGKADYAGSCVAATWLGALMPERRA